MHDESLHPSPADDLLRASKRAARESRELLDQVKVTARLERTLIVQTRSQVAESQRALAAIVAVCESGSAPLIGGPR
jgi:hypothetical protein